MLHEQSRNSFIAFCVNSFDICKHWYTGLKNPPDKNESTLRYFESLHAFLSSTDFFNKLFQRKNSGIPSDYQAV